MIERIELSNFKIHSCLDLPLGGLTVLTGQNGMGKSSLLQALLLLRQSCNRLSVVQGINLKGDLIDLGSANDIECQSSDDGVLGIGLWLSGGGELTFKFSYDVEPHDTFLPLVSPANNSEDFQQCALFTNDFQYISAYRFGPLKGYERDTNVVQYQRQISKENGRCEYAIHFLAHFGKRVHCLPEMLLNGTNDDDLLESQVQKWLQLVSPRVFINIEQVGADYKLNYKFSRDGQPMTSLMPAINVGYGITYVLPILIALLSARPGSLILIENPEAHIHPRAQAELMRLVMRAVKAGVQIVVETHSDHIMNGALVSIAGDETCQDMVKAYYFERDEATHTSVPRRLEIMKDGRVMNPPEGFFDQIDIDMRTLMGF